MRVTNKMMVENIMRDLTQNQELTSVLNDRSGSGKAFKYSSEDPSTVSAVLNIRSSLAMSTTYQTTAQSADDWMTASESALDQITKLLTKAISLAKSGLSDTLSGEERSSTLGTEMKEILTSAVELANSTHQGNYLFAGFQVRLNSGDPFTLNADGTVSYHGDAGVIKREIGPNQSVTINTNGNAAFAQFFNGVSAAIDALNNNNTTNLQASLDVLEESANDLSDATTTNAARLSQLKDTITRMTGTQTELKSLLSSKENVNAADVISQLRLQETVYQSILEVAQRTISASNLFDYLS